MRVKIGFCPFVRFGNSQTTLSGSQSLSSQAKLRVIGGRKATGPWFSDSRVAGITEIPSYHDSRWLGFFLTSVSIVLNMIQN